jgi:hypothetical protein
MSLSPPKSSSVSQLLAELNATPLTVFDESKSVERRSQLMGRIAEYLLVSLIVGVIAGIEVGRWYFKTPPQPRLVCAFALGVTGYALLRIWMILPQLRVLAREREARGLLKGAVERLCSKGYVLFEGVTGLRGFSLGSVLAGPTGVFCLIPRFLPRGNDLTETVEQMDNGLLRIGRRELLADPMDQARRAAAGLYELLAAENLETVPVQPVVVFPGWTVRQAAGIEDPGVLATGDQELEALIRGANTKLEPRMMIAVGELLEKHLRPAL